MAASPARQTLEPPLPFKNQRRPSFPSSRSPRPSPHSNDNVRRSRASLSSEWQSLVADKHSQHANSPPGVSPVSSPFERPATPDTRPSETNNPELEDVVEGERQRYRSWRQGKATWSAAAAATDILRTKMRETDRVDKKIQATLPPKVDLATAARSRKTSHYLGLFKENDAAQEQKRRDERIRSQDVRGGGDGVARQRQERPAQTTLDRGMSIEDIKAMLAANQKKSMTDLSKPRESSSRGVGDHPSDPAAINATIPERGLPGTQLQHGASRALDEEEEGSEREQIASAMYFPHRQVAREAATEEEEFIQEIVNKDHTHEKPPSRPKEQRQKDDQVQASDEVEISLHARDDDHYLHSDLHGDLKAASYPSEDQELTKVRPTDYTAALSESESENESARSQYGYDSSTTDDLSATPTAKAKIDEAKEPK
ncbi:hypothetical protein LTS18_014041, partial [Coniosporium uncinatum]